MNLKKDLQKKLYEILNLNDYQFNYLNDLISKKLNSKEALLKEKMLKKLNTYSFEKTSKFNDIIHIHTNAKEPILMETLLELRPWRKGPFKFNDILIDSEWKSQKKWNRIKYLAKDFKNKVILDIGANSGYYSIQSFDYDPAYILSVDPYINYYYQFKLLNISKIFKNICYLPIGIQDIPNNKNCFDIILNMGILYHQANPINFLKHCYQLLKKKGKMILETIIWPKKGSISFTPLNRYAGMKNIYHIPTIECLMNWCCKIGFKKIECIDTTKTLLSEQRQTSWITGYSLNQFLDIRNSKKTIEGYHRPVRSIIILQK